MKKGGKEENKEERWRGKKEGKMGRGGEEKKGKEGIKGNNEGKYKRK